ncbi:MFS general substrate transporter [Aureobasidium pullulans]|nr:MFS general substrate transporter [Aureobasidium pullulans]
MSHAFEDNAASRIHSNSLIGTNTMGDVKVLPHPAVEEASTHNAEDTTNNEPPTIPTWRLTLLIISLCIGLFLSLLDTSIVATALYSISIDFNATRSSTWVALSYTLTYLGFAVPFANLSDVIGRKHTWFLAFILFFAFSLACGFAKTLAQLVGFRAVQGVGGSGLYSLTIILLPEIVEERKKKWIGAVAGLVVAVAGVMGPVVGGVVTRYTTWRWVFWINGPIGVIAAVLFLLTWPGEDMMKHPPRRSWKRLDFLGSFLLIAASVLVVFAFQQAGLTPNSWTKAIFLAPLLIGLLCWIILFAWELFASTHSISTILPPRLLKRRIYTSAVIVTTLTGFANFIAIYSLPLHFQIVNGTSSLTAGVALLPMLASAAVGSILGGLTASHSFPALAIASALMALGSGLLSTLSVHHGVQAKTYGFEVLLGLGLGLSISSSTLVAATNCERGDHAVAQGIVAQARVLGGSIGIAASSAILGVMSTRKGVVDERVAYTDAFSKTMWVSAVVACVALIFSVGTYKKAEKKQEVEEEEAVTEGHEGGSEKTV